jgi:hypothetical protein
VPQTGNAVEGFCPGVVQVCAGNFSAIKKQNKTRDLLIVSLDLKAVPQNIQKAERRLANILLKLLKAKVNE